MEVARVLELFQRHELVPIQRDRILHQPVDLELPLVARDLRMDAHVQHGKIIDLPLAGRQALDGALGGQWLSGTLCGDAFLGGDVFFVHG